MSGIVFSSFRWRVYLNGELIASCKTLQEAKKVFRQLVTE